MIVSNIFMVSVGVFLYIVARSLPRLQEEAQSTQKKSVIDRFVTSDIPRKIDEIINSFLGKFLRKTKVFLMRFDNSITKKLQTMGNENNNGNSNGKPKINFDEITSETPKNRSTQE